MKYVDFTKRKDLDDLTKDEIEEINMGKPYINKNGQQRYRKLLNEEIYIAIYHIIIRGFSFATLTDTDEVLWFNEESGIWEYSGEVLIKRIGRNIRKELSRAALGEIIDKIRTASYIKRDLFDSGKLLALENKVINLETFEVTDHASEFYLTRKLPVVYDPEARCPETMIFFSEIVTEAQILYEIIAYCLFPGYPIQKAFMFVGSGANGKSTFINLVCGFLGQHNVSSVELQRITTDRFAVAGLYGKMANLCADLPSKSLKKTGMFKALRGYDYITADIKNKNPFQFRNTAKLIFSCNQIPASHDDTDAFYRSWIIIEYPNQFLGKKADKNLLEKLTTKEELSGLLNEVLNYLKPLIERGSFIGETENIEQLKQEYILKSDNIKAFVTRECKEGPEQWTPKHILYTKYKEFCNKYNSTPRAINIFSKDLKTWTKNVEISHKRIDGKKRPIYTGIVWTAENEPEFRVLSSPIAERDSPDMKTLGDGSSVPSGPGILQVGLGRYKDIIVQGNRKNPGTPGPLDPLTAPSEPWAGLLGTRDKNLELSSQELALNIEGFFINLATSCGPVDEQAIFHQFKDEEPADVRQVIEDMMSAGIIFSPLPGKYKLVEGV